MTWKASSDQFFISISSNTSRTDRGHQVHSTNRPLLVQAKNNGENDIEHKIDQLFFYCVCIWIFWNQISQEILFSRAMILMFIKMNTDQLVVVDAGEIITDDVKWKPQLLSLSLSLSLSFSSGLFSSFVCSTVGVACAPLLTRGVDLASAATYSVGCKSRVKWMCRSSSLRRRMIGWPARRPLSCWYWPAITAPLRNDFLFVFISTGRRLPLHLSRVCVCFLLRRWGAHYLVVPRLD